MQDNSYTGNVFMENSHNEPKYIEMAIIKGIKGAKLI